MSAAELTDWQRANAERWVATLRDPDWLQGQGYLRTTAPTGEHKFCCLGVACEISPEAVRSAQGYRFKRSFHDTDYVSMPPTDFMEWEYGVDADFMDQLANANDGGASFEVIADRIEEVLGL